MVVDVHVHLGECRVFDEVTTEDDILRSMDDNGVDVSVVQPLFTTIDIDAYRNLHDRIYRFTRAYPGKIFGMASMCPHIKTQDYKDELKRCVEELGFKAVKLQPAAHACAPNSRDGMMVAETAANLGIAMMIHTGAGVPNSLPANVIPVAKEFPDMPIIMAHSGMIIGSCEAPIVAQLCPNVYLETSWCVPAFIKECVKHIGKERVMFASDEWLNVPAEIAKLKYLGLDPQEFGLVMGENANRVLRLGL